MLKLHFYNHAFLVTFVEMLADEMVPFLFDIVNGELTLEIKESELPQYLRKHLEEEMAYGEASLAGLSQLSM